jgi:ELWxxDGT repeat protein
VGTNGIFAVSLIHDVDPSGFLPAPATSPPGDGKVLFATNHAAHGHHLRMTDGNAVGTFAVKDTPRYGFRTNDVARERRGPIHLRPDGVQGVDRQSMTAKVRKYWTRAAQYEERARKARSPQDREWQMVLARAYRMLAAMDSEPLDDVNRRRLNSQQAGP